LGGASSYLDRFVGYLKWLTTIFLFS